MSNAATKLNVVANSQTLMNRLDDFETWRETVIQAIINYASWLDNQSIEDTNTNDLHGLIQTIRDDKLVVAMVGEYSRGKTELINAMFFSEYDCRLLPSTPGRTTMCPTEIFYDPGMEPCIRLLPIETRLQEKTVVELKRRPKAWTVKPLNVDSIDDMSEVLQELVNNKLVPVEQAETLGFVQDDDMSLNNGSDEIEIPVWRHAQINYPHPLLEQGLVVLDTPGLNALGSEPELTLRMLPSANAVIFVLAADTGVTQSDLNIWKNHVCVATKSSNRSRLAVLNKIDTLWDELLTPKQIAKNIDKQITDTGKLLTLEKGNVFPVSAVKGLVARIQKNDDLLDKSGLVELEKKLSTDLIQSKQEILRETISSELGDRVRSSQGIIAASLAEKKSQAQELLSLDGKSEEIVETLIVRLRQQKKSLETEVESFVNTRQIIDNHINDLLTQLDPKRFDAMFKSSSKDMYKSLTTIGLRRTMARLFKEIERSMQAAEVQTEKVRGLLDQSYQHFHHEFKMPKITPARFNMKRHNRKLASVIEEANEFRESTETIVNKQSVVIKRFFETFVDRIRVIIVNINKSARIWAANVLNPIRDQLKEQKRLINQRLENLESLQANRDNLKEQFERCKSDIKDMTSASKTLNEIMYILKTQVGYDSNETAYEARQAG